MILDMSPSVLLTTSNVVVWFECTAYLKLFQKHLFLKQQFHLQILGNSILPDFFSVQVLMKSVMKYRMVLDEKSD